MRTSYLNWEDYLKLINSLNGNKFRLLIALQGMCGLRISDALNLTWSDILNTNEVKLKEKKTGKERTIYFNSTLMAIIQEEYKEQNGSVFVFRSKFCNKPMSLEYVNRQLKEIFCKFDVEYNQRVSSHLFRKTFGRRYMEINKYSDKALLMLNEVFGHSTIAITKIYLGINEDEKRNVYLNLV